MPKHGEFFVCRVDIRLSRHRHGVVCYLARRRCRRRRRRPIRRTNVYTIYQRPFVGPVAIRMSLGLTLRRRALLNL